MGKTKRPAKSKSRTLTDRRIRSAPPGDHPDVGRGSVVGLQLRVNAARERSWSVRYRFQGRQRRDEVGSWPAMDLGAARDAAREVRSKARNGEDPRGDEEQITFRQLAERYLERHAKPHKAASSAAEDERNIGKDLLPAWGDRLATEITRKDVIKLVQGVADRGAPVHANRVRALASKVFSFGIQRGDVDSNPVRDTPRPGKETSRDRVLSSEEIRVLWKWLEGVGSVTALGLQLALLTLARNGELQAWRWAQIEGAWWELPREFSKARLPIARFISPQVRRILDRLDLDEGPWVLSSPRPGGRGRATKKGPGPEPEPRPLGRLRPPREEGCPVEDWTPHDLRRTGTTIMARLGVPFHVRELALGHKLSGVGFVYDRHTYRPEIENAYRRLGSEVDRIVSGAEGKVLPFGKE